MTTNPSGFTPDILATQKELGWSLPDLKSGISVEVTEETSDGLVLRTMDGKGNVQFMRVYRHGAMESHWNRVVELIAKGTRT